MNNNKNNNTAYDYLTERDNLIQKQMAILQQIQTENQRRQKEQQQQQQQLQQKQQQQRQQQQQQQQRQQQQLPQTARRSMRQQNRPCASSRVEMQRFLRQSLAPIPPRPCSPPPKPTAGLMIHRSPSTLASPCSFVTSPSYSSSSPVSSSPSSCGSSRRIHSALPSPTAQVESFMNDVNVLDLMKNPDILLEQQRLLNASSHSPRNKNASFSGTAATTTLALPQVHGTFQQKKNETIKKVKLSSPNVQLQCFTCKTMLQFPDGGMHSAVFCKFCQTITPFELAVVSSRPKRVQQAGGHMILQQQEQFCTYHNNRGFQDSIPCAAGAAVSNQLRNWDEAIARKAEQQQRSAALNQLRDWDAAIARKVQQQQPPYYNQGGAYRQSP